MKLGANRVGPDSTAFLVWAPRCQKLEVHLYAPEDRVIETRSAGDGLHLAVAERVPAGSTYKYRLDGGAEYPDPASRSQPEGVHGPSAVVDEHFAWHDQQWRGLAAKDYILYELHAGTFTDEGTLTAIIPYLDYLAGLGITAVELMPLAQFPGNRNWGYDGVFPYAVQHSYGGTKGLKTLVDAAHGKGLAVVLDVVYNHLGPEGNYLNQFGPYFTNRYRTPWGEAVNFDGEGGDGVRRFFIENALRWIDEFHIDGLRLDAVHAIFDNGTPHFLRELTDKVKARGEELGRQVCVIAESDLNDVRLVQTVDAGGYGLDAQWSDDFHHALHAVLTAESSGYYIDFGGVEHLAKAYQNGFVYSGEFSGYRGREHGTPTTGISGSAFVVCSQNHDQIGNRMLGERLAQLLSFDELKLAAAAVLIAPFVPLLFMGQEYAETAPFLYFVSHTDPGLVEAVRQGRRLEFASFAWDGDVPDPQSEETFGRSRLDHALRSAGKHQALNELYRTLIALRRNLRALSELNRDRVETGTSEAHRVLWLRRWSDSEQVLAIFHFAERTEEVAIPAPAGRWRKLLDSKDERWMGDGTAVPAEIESAGELRLMLSAKSVVIYSC